MTCICENGQLRVILSETETVRYNIDRVFFERGSKRADEALVSLLKTAVARCGFKTEATKFTIEIYPVYDGGCEVYFIPGNERERLRIKATVRPVRDGFTLFEFDDSESMMSAVELLYRLNREELINSSLFEKNGRYRLLLNGVRLRDPTPVSEFASRRLQLAVDRAATVEHWKKVAGETAVDTVGAALCRRQRRPKAP